MANSFKEIEVGALSLIKEIESKVKGLNTEISELNKSVIQLLKGGGGSQSELSGTIKKLETQIENLKVKVKDQATEEVKLIQKRIDMNNSLARQKEKSESQNFKQAQKATQVNNKRLSDNKKSFTEEKAIIQQKIDLNNSLRKQKEKSDAISLANDKKYQAQLKKASLEEKAIIQKKIDLNNSLRAQKQKEISDNEKAIATERNAIKKQIADEKRLLQSKQKSAQKQRELSQSSRESLARQKKAALEMARPYNVLIAKQKQAKKTLQDLTVSQGKNSRETRKAQRSYDRLSKKVDKANRSTSRFGKSGLGGVSRGFRNLLGAFGIVGGISIFRSIVKDVFELTKTFDGLGFALERVAGDSLAAADSQRFLADLVDDFGVELVSTTNRWIKFLAAAKQSGVSLKDTEDIFRTMAKVSGVLGLKTDELTGIYLALEQMLSKGKVTTEELRRQLGERLPGAMGIMANAVGVTVSELDKMLKKGEVLSAEVLPKFAKAVELAYSLDNIDRVETLVAEQNRLTAAWQTFIKNVTTGDSAIKKTFGFILSVLKESVKLIDNFFAGNDVNLQKSIVASTDILKMEMDEKAEADLMMDGFKFRRELAKADLALKQTTNDKDALIAEEGYRVAQKNLQDHNAKKDAIIKKSALEGIEDAKIEFNKQTKLYEDFLKKERELELQPQYDLVYGSLTEDNIEAVFGDELFNGAIIKTRDDFKEAFSAIEDNVADATAKWVLFKKLIETTKVVTPEPDEDDGGGGGRKTKDTRLRDEFELNKLIIEQEIKKYKIIADNKDIVISLRSQARKSQLESEKELVDLILDYELDSNKKTDEKTRLVEKKRILNKLDLNRKYYDDLLSIMKSYNKATLGDIKDQLDDEELIRDEKIILERKKLQEEGSLSSVSIEEDLVNLRDELYKEDTDNFIAQLIEKKEAELASEDNPELQKALRRQIADLQEVRANIGETGDVAKKATTGLNSFFQSFQNDFFSGAGFDELNQMFLTFDENGLSEIDRMLEESGNDWKVYFAGISEVAQEAFNFINSTRDAYFDQQFSRLEQERDIAIQFAGDSTTAREEIERQYEARRVEIQRKQAQSQKEQALFNIGVNTAQAIVATLAQTPPPAGIPLAILVGAMGAAQLAMVAATPVPEFFRGTMNSPEGYAMVDEKRPEVHTDRNGKIKSTGESGANMRWLDSGDKIYTSHEEYFNKELSGVLGQNDIVPYNQMMSSIAPSISVESGLKKEDFIREIRSMKNSLMSKEGSVVNIDKNGIQTRITKNGISKNNQNNILRLKTRII